MSAIYFYYEDKWHRVIQSGDLFIAANGCDFLKDDYFRVNAPNEGAMLAQLRRLRILTCEEADKLYFRDIGKDAFGHKIFFSQDLFLKNDFVYYSIKEYKGRFVAMFNSRSEAPERVVSHSSCAVVESACFEDYQRRKAVDK